MQTHFSDAALARPHIQRADKVLRSCVHCGFCNATCPTYQLLGDERDGPRGRIYLIKQLLESDPESQDSSTRQQASEITRETQRHLDRCLSCRSCETTCPSGVQYHTLLDIGRQELERRVGRPWRERLLRSGLRHALVEPARFKALLALGVRFRPLAPGALADKIPLARERDHQAKHPAVPVTATPSDQALSRQGLSQQGLSRQVLMLEGCVQPGLAPNINAATARVLARFGIGVTPIQEAGCCGAIDYHLNAQQAGRARMRANIDAWWPAIEAGAEAIVQTASGCGAFVKEYGEMLADDPDYAERAARVSALARDIVEVLGEEIARDDRQSLAATPDQQPLAFHCPCTLQHAQGLGGEVEKILSQLGFTLAPVMEGHLCCGSAGTYSITQPELSRQLRDRKLEALEANGPARIATANIGCQTHLSSAGRTPVSHWIELVDDALPETLPQK
ncbi:glycolate oxidase subunit GlcF [Cobetia sp. 29-18-1]|uniref:glycolate oxidase subunit GlcF n=1 Tax=Cobetia sp. 29-18-1 TaxID=3040018 RepID=UPI00244B1ADA|nr:glycolate oxidase subunit GlcF [Cobetia sp. 29-18-1]MDH2299144.1 glycolate oxidase subunit GlcF [Cobetia sp. 29-18-1]